jgi:hypothetical protein
MIVREREKKKMGITQVMIVLKALYLYTFVYVCTMPSMAPVNTTCPIEIMYTCLMRQYRDFLKGVQSTHCPLRDILLLIYS